MLLANFKNLHTSETKTNVMVAKMVEFVETCDQYLRRFNFGNFFNSIILLPPPIPVPRFCWEKNRS